MSHCEIASSWISKGMSSEFTSGVSDYLLLRFCRKAFSLLKNRCFSLRWISCHFGSLRLFGGCCCSVQHVISLTINDDRNISMKTSSGTFFLLARWLAFISTTSLCAVSAVCSSNYLVHWYLLHAGMVPSFTICFLISQVLRFGIRQCCSFGRQRIVLSF